MSELALAPAKNMIMLGALGLALFSLPALGQEPGPVIVGNGGFEMEDTDVGGPLGWNATRPGLTADSAILQWDDQVSFTGKRSVSISILESHPDTVVAYSWNRPAPGFRTEKTYNLTGWVKTQDLKGSPFLVIQCWSRDMGKLLCSASTQQEFNLTGTNDWTQLKTTIALPQNTWRVMILAGIMAPENRGGKVWFDDILFARIMDE